MNPENNSKMNSISKLDDLLKEKDPKSSELIKILQQINNQSFENNNELAASLIKEEDKNNDKSQPNKIEPADLDSSYISCLLYIYKY